MTIKNLEAEYEQLNQAPEYFSGNVQAFLTKIHSQPKELWESLLPLYEKIGDDLFNRTINAPNYNIEEFRQVILNHKAFKASAKTKNKTQKKEVDEPDFEVIFISFWNTHRAILKVLKGYYCFHLNSSLSGQFETIFLCDEEYKHNPHLVSLEKNAESEVKISTIQEFSDSLRKDPVLLNKKYLCLVFLTPRLTSKPNEIHNLKEIFSQFNRPTYISITNSEVKTSMDFEYKNVDQIIYEDYIESYYQKILNNKSLSFYEEDIIKRSFSNSDHMILEYKILKAGFSGSKVIEVQPISRSFQNTTKRYVVKYSIIERGKHRKLKDENTRFETNIGNIVSQTYQCSYHETSIYEALKYTYASSDGKKDSVSFSNLIDQFIREKRDSDITSQAIELLFDCELFQRWKDTQSKEEGSVKEKFSAYLNDESSILEWISKIKNLPVERIREFPLVKNYETIKNFVYTSYKKVCHGDLHSENFFKDDQEVFLIDFGFTGPASSIIDHATIEASIKFKHLPSYLKKSEIKGLEEALSLDSSFSGSLNSDSVERPLLKETLKLITIIRKNSIDYVFHKETKLDYYICLFVITFRQIQYPDLNQIYALISAEILAAKVVQLITEIGTSNKT